MSIINKCRDFAILFCLFLTISIYFGVLDFKIVSVNKWYATEQKVYLFEKRHKLTQRFLPADGSDFRFVTYNILNDGFASTDIAKSMYWYCPQYALNKEYRRPLILRELVGYHGDFLCLQECDADMFHEYLSPNLQRVGYEGVFKVKHKGRREGEALFYRTERYEHLKDLSITVKDAINHNSNSHLLARLPKQVLKIILNRKALGLIHILRDKLDPNKKLLCIVNTHLYYLPTMAHIRLVQMAILMNYLNVHIDQYNTNIIVAGDLNSPSGFIANSTGEPVLRYLAGSVISKNDIVWKGEGGEIDFVSPIPLKSLSGTPEYTCYSPPEIATYDHIFGTLDSLKVSFFLPIPSVGEIMKYGGVPSVVYPSDHFAVVIDIQVKGI